MASATTNEVVSDLGSLSKKYPNKNAELRRVALYAFECAKNTIREGSAGSTIGADEHFVARQKNYVEGFQSLLEELADRPLPDAFGLPDTQFPIDMSEELRLVTTGLEGSEVPLNEDLQLVTIDWMQLAVMLASSDSAGWRGSMNDHDYKRATNAAAVIAARIGQIEEGPAPDFAATSDPGAARKKKGG